LVRPGPRIGIAEIAAFERELKATLPQDYKSFLLGRNGGGVMKPDMGFTWRGGFEKLAVFHRLVPKEHEGLRGSWRDLRRLDRDAARRYVPVACTVSDREVCVCVRGGQRGAVFVTDYTYRTLECGDTIPIAVRMAPLASSFSAFLEMLVELPEPPEPDCPIWRLGTRGTPEELREYLDRGNSIDAVGENGLTIVCQAVASGNVPIVQACIAYGARLDGAVRQAVSLGRAELIEVLVRAGADINERDEWGDTPLHWLGGDVGRNPIARANRRVREVVCRLGGIDPYDFRRHAAKLRPEHLEKYVRVLGSIDAVDQFGLTLVRAAIVHNNVPLVEACLERGANLAGTIHAAVEYRRIRLIRRLVHAGADVNERTADGLTPLYYARVCCKLPGRIGASYCRLRDLLVRLGAKE